MQHIKTHIKRAADDSRKTERGELLKYFCERINAERLADGYPKITIGRMGKMLEKVPTKDLYYLKRVCDDAKNFSKRFWVELNPKKYEKKYESAKKK